MPTINNKTLTPPLFVNSDVANHHADRASTEFTRRGGWGVRSHFVRAVLPPLPVAVLLIASLTTFAVAAVAQDDAQPEPETQTLEVQVVDEEGAAIEGVSLRATHVVYQRKGEKRFNGIDEPRVETNGEGEATFVFPVGVRGPIARVYLRAHHNSFLEGARFFDIDDELVTITLQRGLQVAASGLDPVTKKPIEVDLYAMTNQQVPIDWKLKSNGTLISPIIGKDQSSFRLVQIEDGKPTRFSELVDITHGETSRLLFRDLEMTDAVTVTGKLSDDVPRPVKYGMVMACVASISKADKDPLLQLEPWCWKTFAKVDRDGTFILEGIPADSILQIHCQSRGWANKPPPQDKVLAEFPNEANNNNRTAALPHLAEIGRRPTEITVPMHAMGDVTVNVVDQNNQPIRRAKVSISVWTKFFYSRHSRSYRDAESSLKKLIHLRPESSNNTSPGLFSSALRGMGVTIASRPKTFYSEKTNRDGIMEIKGVPAGDVRVTVSDPDGQRFSKQAIVKSNENVDVELSFNRPDPEDGGDDD